MTRKHEQLLFVKVTAYNATFNYTVYNLVYRAERSRYNFTLITKILTDPKTGEYRAFVTGMNIAPHDKDKALPVGDTVLVLGNLTLSDYYWTLNKVLMKLRRGDETNWVWGRSAYELRHLSHLVRLKLPEYNSQGKLGYAITMDSYSACSHICDLACSSAFTLVCIAAVGSSEGLLGAACLLGGVFCSAFCTAVCGNHDLASFFIGSGISFSCSKACEYGIKNDPCANMCGFLGNVCKDACTAVLTPLFCPQLCAILTSKI